MSGFFGNWNFLRIVRLLAGGGLLVYGYRQMDWPLLLIGFMLALMAVTNSGCSPFDNRACDIDRRHGRVSEDNK